MAVVYILAGCYHFINPNFYTNIIPYWLPYPSLAVNVSGVVEIALGIGLLIQPYRKLAALTTIAMLVTFFFLIHVPMALTYYQTSHPYVLIALVRLPIQLLLIYWAWKCRKIRL